MTAVDPTRSRIMGAVRQKNTAPETIVRQVLHRLGLRFRLHRKGLPGTPDIVLPRHRTVVFVHGCFWHRHRGCGKASTPKTRLDFWQEKFDRNVERDARNESALVDAGWRVLIVWECETKNVARLTDRLKSDFALPG
ncbi:MAG TPA: DNA mismatch endonuclease Vsr [Sphingomonas sp.]